MSVKTNNYAANLTNSTSLRGPSPSVWYDCPIPDFQQDPSLGMAFFDDFLLTGNPGSTSGGAVAASLGAWSVYAYQGATIGDGALEGGVLTYGADGDDEGLALLSSTGSFRLVTTSTLALNQKLWFEARIATSTVAATKHEDFIGLCTPSLSSGLPAAAVPISTTADTLSTTPSLIGFHRKSTASPTDWSFVFQLASGTPNYPTGLTTLRATVSLATLTANTFTKLGFVFDPNALTAYVTSATARQTAGTLRRKLIRVFADGLELPTFLSSDDVQNATSGQAFPTAFMAPCVAAMNQTGSSPGTSSVDWIRVAQLANS